jgi:REP element-mobilizing transposase RayT
MLQVLSHHNVHSAFINGYVDHCHVLFSLSRSQTIADVMKIIKGESSYWLNKANYFETEFRWQDDYWISSVSRSQLNKVRNYIANQEKHHSKFDLSKELEFLSIDIR